MPPSTRNFDAVMNDASSAGQEGDRGGDLVRLGEPAHRDVHQPPGGPLRVLGEQLLQQRGVHRAGAEGVDPDALAGELHAQLPGHRQHAALATRCRRSARSPRPSRATKDAVLMIEPLPWRRMCGIAYLQHR